MAGTTVKIVIIIFIILLFSLIIYYASNDTGKLTTVPITTPTTPSIATPSGYQGCFADRSANRALPNYKGQMPFLKCEALAKEAGVDVFGMQNWLPGPGAECWLGNTDTTLEIAKKYGAANNCQDRDGLKFGGPLSNAVYSI